MDKNILYFVFSILIIIVIFYILNMYIKKPVEKFGIYCGSYNLHSNNTAQKHCSNDQECAWISIKDPNTGLMNSWCSQNPNGVGNETQTSSSLS
jgi:hypothetical protein